MIIVDRIPVDLSKIERISFSATNKYTYFAKTWEITIINWGYWLWLAHRLLITVSLEKKNMDTSILTTFRW